MIRLFNIDCILPVIVKGIAADIYVVGCIISSMRKLNGIAAHVMYVII